MSPLLVTSNLTVKVQRPLGVPAGLRLNKLPSMIARSLDGVRFITGQDISALEREVTEVRVAGKVIQRTRVLRNGQSLQLTLKADEKRANDTNMALINPEMPGSKAVAPFTPHDVNRSFDEQVAAGLEMVATVHQSNIGMNTLVLAPSCMAFNLQAGARLQRLFDWEGAIAAQSATTASPLQMTIHHVHVIGPWLSEWFGGVQKGLYTRGHNIAVTINTKNYIGLWKKPFLYAHEWFCMNSRPELGILHAGACRLANGQVMVLTGPSALGKTEISAPLRGLHTPGKLEFLRQGHEPLFVDVGEDPGAAMRKLLVDDMVVFYIDSRTGELYLWDLETGHYVRFDLYRKHGEHPTIDMLAAPGCTVPCSWSNVEYDDATGLINPTHHVTLDGHTTDNPRVVVETQHLPAGYYEPTSQATPVKANIIAVGIPSAPNVNLPTFSIVNNTQLLSLAASGLRANKGNQSIAAQGSAVWIDEGAFTLPPFGDLTEGETVSWLARLLERISPDTLLAFVSNRYSVFEQRNKYEGTWLLRYLLESGVDLRKVPLVRHLSQFAGWYPVLPNGHARLQPLVQLDLTLSEEEIVAAAQTFDAMVHTRLAKIDLDYTLQARYRTLFRRARGGKLAEPPFDPTIAELAN